MASAEGALTKLVHALLQLRPAACGVPCQHAAWSSAWATTTAPCSRVVGSQAMPYLGGLNPKADAAALPHTGSASIPNQRQVGLYSSCEPGPLLPLPTRSSPHLYCGHPVFNSAPHWQQLFSPSFSSARHMAAGRGREAGRSRAASTSQHTMPSPQRPASGSKHPAGELMLRHIQSALKQPGALQAAVAAAGSAASGRSTAATASQSAWGWVPHADDAVQAVVPLALAARQLGHQEHQDALSFYVAACLPHLDGSQLAFMLHMLRVQNATLDPTLVRGPVMARITDFLLIKGREYRVRQTRATGGGTASGTDEQERGRAVATGAGVKRGSSDGVGALTQLQRLRLARRRARIASVRKLLDAVGAQGDGAEALSRVADHIAALEARAGIKRAGASHTADAPAASKTHGASHEDAAVATTHVGLNLVLLDQLALCGRSHLPLAAAVLERVHPTSGGGLAGCLEAASFVVPESAGGELSAAWAELARCATASAPAAAHSRHAHEMWSVYAEHGAARALEAACTHLDLGSLTEASKKHGQGAQSFRSDLLLGSALQLLRLHRYNVQHSAAFEPVHVASGSGSRTPEVHDPYAASAPTCPLNKEEVHARVGRALALAERLDGFLHLPSIDPLLRQVLEERGGTSREGDMDAERISPASAAVGGGRRPAEALAGSLTGTQASSPVPQFSVRPPSQATVQQGAAVGGAGMAGAVASMKQGRKAPPATSTVEPAAATAATAATATSLRPKEPSKQLTVPAEPPCTEASVERKPLAVTRAHAAAHSQPRIQAEPIPAPQTSKGRPIKQRATSTGRSPTDHVQTRMSSPASDPIHDQTVAAPTAVSAAVQPLMSSPASDPIHNQTVAAPTSGSAVHAGSGYGKSVVASPVVASPSRLAQPTSVAAERPMLGQRPRAAYAAGHVGVSAATRRRAPLLLLPLSSTPVRRPPSLLNKVVDWADAVSLGLPSPIVRMHQDSLLGVTKSTLGRLAAAGPAALDTVPHVLWGKSSSVPHAPTVPPPVPSSESPGVPGTSHAPASPAQGQPAASSAGGTPTAVPGDMIPALRDAGAAPVMSGLPVRRLGVARVWGEVVELLRAAAHPHTGNEPLLLQLGNCMASQPAWLQLQLVRIVADTLHTSTPSQPLSETAAVLDMPTAALQAEGQQERQELLAAVHSTATPEPATVQLPQVDDMQPPRGPNSIALRRMLHELQEACLADRLTPMSLRQLAELAALYASPTHAHRQELLGFLHHRLIDALRCPSTPAVGHAVCSVLHSLDAAGAEANRWVLEPALAHLQQLARERQLGPEKWSRLLPVLLRSLAQIGAQEADEVPAPRLGRNNTSSSSSSSSSSAGDSWGGVPAGLGSTASHGRSAARIGDVLGDVTMRLVESEGPQALLAIALPALEQEPAALLGLAWGVQLLEKCLEPELAHETPPELHITVMRLLLAAAHNTGTQVGTGAVAAAGQRPGRPGRSERGRSPYPDVQMWSSRAVHELQGEWGQEPAASAAGQGSEAFDRSKQLLEQLSSCILGRLDHMGSPYLIDLVRVVSGVRSSVDTDAAAPQNGGRLGSRTLRSEAGMRLQADVQARLLGPLLISTRGRLDNMSLPQLSALLMALLHLPPALTFTSPPAPHTSQTLLAQQLGQWAQVTGWGAALPPRVLHPQKVTSPVAQLVADVQGKLLALLRGGPRVGDLCRAVEALGADGLMGRQSGEEEGSHRGGVPGSTAGQRTMGTTRNDGDGCDVWEAGASGGRAMRRVAMPGAAVSSELLQALFLAAERVLMEQPLIHVPTAASAVVAAEQALDMASGPLAAARTCVHTEGSMAAPAAAPPATAAAAASSALTAVGAAGLAAEADALAAALSAAELSGLSAVRLRGHILEKEHGLVEPPGSSHTPVSHGPAVSDALQLLSSFSRIGLYSPHVYRLACSQVAAGLVTELSVWAEGSALSQREPAIGVGAGALSTPAYGVLSAVGSACVSGTPLAMGDLVELLQSLARVGHTDPVVVDLAARALAATMAMNLERQAQKEAAA